MASGFDFGENDPDPIAEASGHGVQTALVLGARGNDGVGMAGVAWNVRIMPLEPRWPRKYALGDHVHDDARALSKIKRRLYELRTPSEYDIGELPAESAPRGDGVPRGPHHLGGRGGGLPVRGLARRARRRRELRGATRYSDSILRTILSAPNTLWVVSAGQSSSYPETQGRWAAGLARVR
jgi:hypothetical protein